MASQWPTRSIVLWFAAAFLLFQVCCSAETHIGGMYESDHNLTQADGPYAVTQDLIINKGATLTIEAGVQLNFQARVRMVVSGTLIAKGSPASPISMFHNATVGRDTGVIRLVGGNSVREGRIEMFNGQNWGTVCDDYWNSNNARVVCRQLGFGSPTEVSTRRFGPGSGSIGLSNVNCDGVENSLLDCRANAWNSNNCKHSEDVGVVCGEGSVGFWGGIVFSNDSVIGMTENNARKYYSNSVLENIEIMDAGVAIDTVRRSQPDLQVPVVTITTASPVITNVTLLRSRHIGVLLDTVHSDVKFTGLTVINSTSSGIAGSCSWQFTCSSCHLSGNGVSGIDITRLPLLLEHPHISAVQSFTLDYHSSTSGSFQSFPIGNDGCYVNFTSATPGLSYYISAFETTPGYGLSISFQRLKLNRNYLRLYDGVTGQQVLFWWFNNRNILRNFSIPSHQLLINIAFDYSYGTTGDILAYVAPYKLDARGVKLDSCTVSGADFDNRWSSGIRLSGTLGAVQINNCHISNTRNTGIQFSGSASGIVMSSTSIVNGTGSPTGTTVNVYLKSMALYDVRVEGYYYGLSASFSSQANISISNSSFIRNRYRGAYVYWNQPYLYNWPLLRHQKLDITHSIFTDTASSYGLYVYVYNSYSTASRKVTISSNFFERNVGGLYYDHRYRDVTSEILRNTFIDNNGGCCNGAMYLYSRFYYPDYPQWVDIIDGNQFIGNSGEYVVKLFTSTSFHSSYQLGPVIIFRDNNITNSTVSQNTTSSSSKSTPHAVMDIVGTVYVNAYHNTFNNPNASKDLAVQAESVSSLDQVNVTLNWWGTANELEIHQRIFDFDDASRLAVANYFPFLLSPLLSDVATSSHPRMYPPFVRANSEVGGQLATNVTLLAVGSPYTVTRDITVLPTGVLTIEAGTIIRFQPNVGMLVEGQLFSDGLLNQPVILTLAQTSISQPSTGDVHARLTDGGYYSTSASGSLEVQLQGTWYPVCLRSERPDYTALGVLVRVACLHLGYERGSWVSNYWYPSLGKPVVRNFRCPYNASVLNDCSFNRSTYSPKSNCLVVVRTYCYRSYSYQQSGGSYWAGIRFAPTSSVPSSNGSHQVPKSKMRYTEIINAGQWTYKTVPAIQAIFRPPETIGVTIINSASTGLEVSYLHENAKITGVTVIGALGDGVSVGRPRGKNLTIDSVAVHNISGTGIRVYRSTSSLAANTDFQSICSDLHNITVDLEDGAYVGMSQDEHTPGIVCSVVLQGPPNTILSVRLVTLRLYNDDRLTLRNGPFPSSPSWRSYSGYTSSLSDPFLSSGNAIYVEIATGAKTGAPGFSLHVEALLSAPQEPFVHIMNSTVNTSAYGVYLSSLYDDTVIDSVSVTDARNYGVYVNSQYGLLTISRNVVANSRGTGVYQSYGRKLMKFIDNHLVNNSRGMYIRPYYYYHDTCGVQISGNVIVGSINEGLYISGDGYGANQGGKCPFEVSKNSFAWNNNGLLIYSYYGYRTLYSFNVTDNIFSANNGTALIFDRRGDWYGTVTSNQFLHHRSKTGGSLLIQGIAEDLNVTDNSFQWNAGKYVVRLALLNFTTAPVVFSNNRLLNNYINETDRVPLDNRSAVVVVGMSDKVIVNDNVFNNPESLYELGVELPVQSSSERIVDVSHNYWGTTDENIIRDRIHDFGYCSRLASAQFFPYSSALGVPVSSTVTRPIGIIRPNSIIRGRVLADTVIPISGSPYVVTGDISVLPGRKLRIETGVELRFTHNTGILVEGQMIADGHENAPIRMIIDGFLFPEGAIRIVGGPTKLEGRVEVFHNGSWGPVCAVQDPNTRYYRTNHDYYNTLVVCRELGHYANYQFPFSDPSFGLSSQPAWLGHVLCRGNEASLRQCTNYVLQPSSCPYGQLVARCRDDGINTDNDYGLLHWTGLRFAESSQAPSSIRHVTIERGGTANDGHIAAVQVVGAQVCFFQVNVTGSAWTGVEVTNSPTVKLSQCSVSSSRDSGVRFVNIPSSSVDALTSRDNSAHGLSLSTDSIPQRLWNIPVPANKIVDICSHSGLLSAASPFYLRFVADPTQRNYAYRTCTASIQSDPQYVISVHVMAVKFKEWSSYVTVDGRHLYGSRRIQFNFPLHYTRSQGTSVSIVVSAYLRDYTYELGENYFLAYIQRHPIGLSNVTSHYFSRITLADNSISGLAINSSRSSFERYDVTLVDSVVTGNSWNGIDINATSDGSSNSGSNVHTFDIQRNWIAQNGKFTTATYGSRSAGVAMQIDKSNVIIQNSAIEKNRGGAVSLKLDSGSEHSYLYLFDNEIKENTAGPTVTVSGTSGTSGPRLHVIGNRISHNSAGILYDALSISDVAANVSTNTFFNNTGRHVVHWTVGSRYSIIRQQCVDNTLYLNVGQTPNYRWSIFADGVAPQYMRNVLTNPSNVYEFVSGVDRSQGHHDAANNWWGTPYLSHAELEVRDKSDESSLATVDIEPIYSNNPWAEHSACLLGWVEFNSGCYLYVSGARTWTSANSYCQGIGSQLASSHSSSEDAFLQNVGISRTLFGLRSPGVWLGMFGTENATWQWADFTSVDYTAWVGTGIATTEELCLKLNSSGWISSECALPLPFVCKQAASDDCPNGCSRHGLCNKQSMTCSCDQGWQSSDCSEFNCIGVNDCSGYGTCVGPNQCRCRVGWKGRACTTTYCNLYTTCQACSRQPGCGWCDEEQECIPGLGDNPDKQPCSSWFYYACYSPIISGGQCSIKIRDISCDSPCDTSVPTSSNETCQHCHDIEGCYQGNTGFCPAWNEERCPYGRVTPDYGRGPDSPKIPSHLPFSRSSNNQPVKRDASASHRDRRSTVDLFPDVRVPRTDQVIYRLLARPTGTSMGSGAEEALFVTGPSLRLELGRILVSSQCGGILDKVTSVSRLGTYRLIKTSPATLEDVIKYADFTERVELQSVFHDSAKEHLPDADALQAIVSAPIPTLEGAPVTYVIPTSVAVYKCAGNHRNGTSVIAIPKTSTDSLFLGNREGIVSTHSSGFIEIVHSIKFSGNHTFIHTTLADCTQSKAPVQLKTSITTTDSPSTTISPSVTGLGGDGRQGLLIYENYLPSGLQVSVGDTIVGRPSGPLAGYVKSYFDSADGTLTYIEMEPVSGIGKPACRVEAMVVDGGDGLKPTVIGGDAFHIGGEDINTGRQADLPVESDDQEGTIAKTWCDSSGRVPFALHQIIRTQMSSTAEMTAELKVAYSPNVVMTLRSNHTNPFVSKIGFDLNGPVVLGTKTKVNVDAAGSSHVDGPTGLESEPAGVRSSPFCTAIGPVCIPGRLLFSANFSFSLDYWLASSAQFDFTHEYELAGRLDLGVLWRTNVGNEYRKTAELKSKQEIPRGTFASASQAPGRSASFKAAWTPSFGIQWPTAYTLPDYIHATVPSFITVQVGLSSLYPSISSSFSAYFQPRLVGQWYAKECADGCDFDHKLGVDLMTGVDEVTASSTVDFRYIKSFESLQPWRLAELTDVVTGLCLRQSSDCSCNCPGNAPCQSFSGLNLCHPCPCTGISSCLCSEPCPLGTVEEKNPFTGMVECKCRCSDFGLANMGSNGTCQCGCTCNDGSESLIQPDGRCDCSCKCNNCRDSELGPSGCQCPNDICPNCLEGLQRVWQDCVCSCQSKQGRGGLPPVCSAGWRGPYCDVPDCSPWPFCSDNGNCTIPLGDDADKLPYCVCEEQWIGAGCHIARPRPGGGDPHLQTLDGISYDFFDIGEFWFCKSQVNDFGMATRFFKYERVSLIGAVALKAGFNVVTITTPSNPSPTDLPNLRINGVLVALTDGLMLDLADGTVHIEIVLFSNSSSSSGGENSGSSVVLIALQYASGVSVTIDVRYSAGMQRQFFNTLFSPTASFKRSTEGLCGYMDGNKSNDLVGSDGVVHQQGNILDFAKSWRINATFSGSGLNGTWSWNHSNFHREDKLDVSYTDPNFIPLYSVTAVDMQVVEMARSVCSQLGLTGARLDECIFDVAVTNDTSLAEQETFQIGCPTQCSGKGRCVNSSCVCLPGWFGDDCSKGSCANCSVNGDCVSGFCQCHFGWEGPYCDRPATCFGVGNCTSISNGLCKAHDVCECTPGFVGSDCSERAYCVNVNECSGHGLCIDHDTCKCQLGWAGLDCSVFSCEVNGYCSGHGSCVEFDVCRCDAGWGGASCALPLCTGVNDCSGNGDCTSSDVCRCYSGYSGQDCAVPDSCPQFDDCSSNGVCVSRNGEEMCRCFLGYSGPNCSEALCFGRNGCSGHGKCVEVDLCQCDYGYSGNNCSRFSCERHRFCSGHGRCLSFDKCTCDENWSGSACQIADCSRLNNCSNPIQGTCVGPDTCLCSAHYDGDDCSVLGGLNSNRPVFNSSVIRSTLASNSPVGSTVITVIASDYDTGKNGRLTYTITSSNNDHLYFKVNSSTGDIKTVKSVSDKEGSLLIFKVIATDSGVPRFSVSAEIQFDVVPPNQYCPTFNGLTPHVVVSDLAAPGTSVVNVTATDGDGMSTSNGMVTYSLSSRAHFSIDSGSGEVTTERPLTADAYTVTVVASDGGSPQCSTTATLLISVHSSNSVPVCDPSSVATSLPYDIAVGTVIFELRAVDPDDGSDGQLTYYYSSFKSEFLQNASPFRLVQNNGTARVQIISSLTQPSDSGPVFYDASFQITVQDAAVRPKSCSYSATITVTQQFRFRHSTLSASLRESVRTDSVVSTTSPLQLLTSVSGVTYELYNADNLPFSIDAATGNLTVTDSLDYEKVRNYNVSVVAKTDQIPGAFALTSVVVNVEDVNDNPPRFPFSRYTVYVLETTARGAKIVSLTATDADSIGGPVNYSVSLQSPVDEDNVFTVTNANGGVDMTLAGDGVLNYQITPVYEFLFKALDTADALLFSYARVRVLVEAVNFTIPVFSDPLYRSSILENSPNGTTVMIISALVNGRPSTQVSYRLANQWSPSKQTNDTFGITDSGQIQVLHSSLLDYERVKEIDIHVIASITTPRLRTAQTTVTITLDDVNDNSPIFSSDRYYGTVSMDDPVGAAIVNLTATDTDSGSNADVTLRLVDGNQDQLFTLTDSGVVTLAASLNETTQESYVLSVTAHDGGQPFLSSITSVEITVTCSSSGRCPSKSTSDGLPCHGRFPFVTFAKDDDWTMNPPTIILRGNEFEKFLIEDPSQMYLRNVTPTNWDNITILLSLRFSDMTNLMSETLKLNPGEAFLEGRVSTSEAGLNLKHFVDFKDGLTSDQDRAYTIQRQLPANLSDVLLSLKYERIDKDNPPPEFRDIFMTINFAEGCGSQDIRIEIRYVGDNNHAPVVNISDQNAVFTEGMFDPISVTNGSLDVTDGDNSFFLIKSATVSITEDPSSEDTSKEELATIVTIANITVTYSAGVLNLTGDATPGEYSRVLNGVTYFNWEEDLGGKPFDSRKLVFTVSDGRFTSSNAVVVHLVNINDPPVIRVDGNRTTSLQYTEGNGPTGIKANLTAVDPDNIHLNGAIIVLCGAVDGDEVTFGVDLPAGVSRGNTSTVSFCLDDHSNGTSLSGNGSCTIPWDLVCSSYGNATFFELHGAASVDEYGELLQSIQYHNTRSPALFMQHNKTIVITSRDGHDFSSPIYIRITFHPVNDGPILQFNPNANPFRFAPLENRRHFVGFTEDGRPVLLFPQATTLFDVDSSFAFMVKLVLTGTVANEYLVWNQTLADQLGLKVITNGSMWTVMPQGPGKATFYQLKKFLLTFRYENNDHSQPVEGVRTVIVVIQDVEGAVSQEVFIYVNVMTRNDRPNLDLGVGENHDDNTAFTEIEEGSQGVGIHISTLPHRIMISDEAEEQHYTTKVIIHLRADGCGQLDTNQEFIYLLGVPPSRIDYDPEVDGRTVTATTTEMIEPRDIQDLTEDYEKLLFDMRYIHMGEEPTVYCPMDDDKPLYRFVDITIFDSGDPTRNRTVSTRIIIIPVNDRPPVVTVAVAGGCLVPENEIRSLNLFDGFMSNPSVKKKRDISTEGQTETESPQVLSVVFRGRGKGFVAGSQVVVKFSVDTNTPVVLRPSNLKRVVSMSPSWLHNLPHIGVWMDPKTLHIVFPVVESSISDMVTADQLVVAFPSPPDCMDCEEDPSCLCICDSSGQSCGISGSYGVYGQIDVAPQKPKGAESPVAMNADNVAQIQLPDCLLITVGIASLGIAVIIVLTISCKRYKAIAGKPQPLVG